MRKTFTLSSAGFASLALLLSSLLGNGARAQASTLSDWQYNPEESALAFQIESGLKPTYFLLPNPLRIVVDLPNTNLQTTQTDRSFSGDVSRIRVSEFEPGVTRLVMELAPNSVLQRGQVSLEDLGNGQWKIRPLIEASGAIATQLQPSARAVELPVIAASEPAGPETTAVQTPTQPSELPMLGPDLAITPDLMPPPRPTMSAIASPNSPQVTVPSLGAEGSSTSIPAVASFTTLINPFEPLPEGAVAAQAEVLAPSPEPENAYSSTALPTLPTLAAVEPALPYLVEFGQPLPGVTSQFPAAYMPRKR